MKKLFGLIVAFLFVVNIAGAQMLHYADSTASIVSQGFSTTSISRTPGDVDNFKTYWWGPYDISECWGDKNVPGVTTQADTLVFRGYMSGIVRYAAGDTVLGTWKAYLSCFPYAPQNAEGTSTTYDFNWNNADSLVSWKIRAASDFVSSKRDGYPMYSKFAIETVASDTIAYPYLYVALELDSTTGTPAGSNPLDISAYWTYDCVKPK